MLKVIRKYGAESRTTIQSFDWRTLGIVHRLAPGIVTVALTDQQADDDTVQVGKPGKSPWLGGLDVDDYGGSVPRLVKASGSGVWSPNALDLDQRVVDEAHALGLKVIPWTVNDPKDMEHVLALGVDGMISDRPDLLRSVLEAKGIAVPSPTRAQ
jgi:glycerophosphoryl diester phosphodiesterase